MKKIAILPLKAHSVRVPDKNFKPFAGSSLADIKITMLLTAMEKGIIDQVVVNSESQHVLDEMQALYPEITPRKRVAYYAYHASGSEFFRNLAEVEAPGSLLIYSPCTSPFITLETFADALRILETASEIDSVVTVEALYDHLWYDHKPLNYQVEESPNSQDLQPAFKITYGIGALPRELMIERRNIIGHTPYFIPLGPKEAVDIDTESDFKIAELYANGIL